MQELKANLEALLFIAAKPLAMKQLAELTEAKSVDIEKACGELAADYKAGERGLELIKNGDKYQLVSSPTAVGVVQKFIQEETGSELSRPSLEALTIIAYRAPVTKGDLDRIRGVNCALILRNLLLRGLIESQETKGEIYYQPSLDFIRHLGVASVEELPDYERLHQHELLNKIVEEDI